MTERFFCPSIDDATVVLTDSEAHHAIHVMRLKEGADLELFDGAGTTAAAVVRKIRRTDVTVSVVAKQHTARPDHGIISVAASPPKGDRLKWMVEKLTELGADRYIPLQTDRTIVDPRASRLEKLSATVISAAKQCRRNWLMDVTAPRTMSDLLSSAGPDHQFVIAHPMKQNSGPCSVETAAGADLTLLIGPEGGFTSTEVAEAQEQRAQLLSWPSGVLRTETAAIVFATLVMSQRQTRSV